MPQLSADERNALKVVDFIFHVVHHGKDEPDLLDSTPIDESEPVQGRSALTRSDTIRCRCMHSGAVAFRPFPSHLGASNPPIQ